MYILNALKCYCKVVHKNSPQNPNTLDRGKKKKKTLQKHIKNFITKLFDPHPHAANSLLKYIQPSQSKIHKVM